MSNKIMLHENVVSDDYLEGVTLHYFTYATEWTDREHVVEFKTPDEAIEWYKTNLTDRVKSQGRYWLEEDGDHTENITDEDAIDEWQCIIDCCMIEE